MEGDERPRLGRTLKDLGESSSLHGIPKIVSSRQLAVKILWGILLCGAVVLFSFQFYDLVKEYLSYPVQTTVSLKFAPLPFPAVTVCNMNPFKDSALSATTDDRLNDLVTQLHTSVVTEDSDPNSTWWEDFHAMYTDIEDVVDVIFDSDQVELTKGAYDNWRTSVLAIFRDIPLDLRHKVGHQLTDFIHVVKFAGFKLDREEEFSVTQNNYYGNCFTIKDLPKALTSGQDNGLTLALNLEISEYMEQIVPAYGAKVVIHEAGTYPLADREGYTLNPGFETNIGLRLARVHHLGGVYGYCGSDGTIVLGDNTYKYSVPICHAMCDGDLVASQCNCFPIESPTGYGNARTCNTSDTECVYSARLKLMNALDDCACPNTCDQDRYVTTISGRTWPVKAYLETVVLKEMCQSNTSAFDSECFELHFNKTLSYENYMKASQNFLKLNIYFEDLNFEEISEQPRYNVIRFLSDIGGLMGLLLGASVLTFVEMLQLILEFILFLKQKHVVSGKTTPLSKLQLNQNL